MKLLGQRLMARGFDRQVVEFRARVAVLNGFNAPGIPVTKLVRRSLFKAMLIVKWLTGSKHRPREPAVGQCPRSQCCNSASAFSSAP